MSMESDRIKKFPEPDDIGLKRRFLELFKSCPIPESELLENIALFLRRRRLSNILFMHELYQKIINVHGIIIEFGVRWGRNLALYESLRGIYEPFNHNRKIVGFDTFEGFPNVDRMDGDSELVAIGSYSVTKNYEEYLKKILDCHELDNPNSHIKKYELIKGDAAVEIEKYLKDNPETIIALAYFDFDIYKPTKRCLEAIKGHLTKGSVLAFDELNEHIFPGETLAFKEVFGLDRYRITRSPISSVKSYIVIE